MLTREREKQKKGKQPLFVDNVLVHMEHSKEPIKNSWN